MAETSNLMAAINPEVFCEPQARAAVKAQMRVGRQLLTNELQSLKL